MITQETKNQKTIIREFEGVVVSKAGLKTVKVRVDRMKPHAKYQKQYKVSRMFMVHDEKEKFNVDDKVRFVECRPISKSKRWRVIYKKS
jgi:small subunit ribosomal protein S17